MSGIDDRRVGRKGVWLRVGLVLLAAALVVVGVSLATRGERARRSAELCTSLLGRFETLMPAGSAGDPADATEEPGRLPALDVDGIDVVGRMSAAGIGLDVPVASAGADAVLVPCLVEGTGSELVVCGSSYQGAFGRIDELASGDELVFVQANGLERRYAAASTGRTRSDFNDDYDLLLYYEDLVGQRHWVGCFESS